LSLVLLGRFLSRMRPQDGVVMVWPNRVEISDSASFEGTVTLFRRHVLDVAQPGVEGEGPNGVNRIELARRVLRIGEEMPNVELWLAMPVMVTRPFPARSGEVTLITMQTPAAATLLAWQRAEPLEERPERQPWYEWLLDELGDLLRSR